MTVSETLLQIRAFSGVGYRPLIAYGEWRLAFLRYIDELLPQNLHHMQRHERTDEVFVLLAGHCILFLEAGGGQVSPIQACDMQPMQLYNIKKGCYHTHTLSPDAVVLIIENEDTNDDNSPCQTLTAAQTAEVISLTRSLWPES